MDISVCITSYKQQHFLKEAVESVLAQTLKPRQVIVIDDDSADGSQEFIAGLHTCYPGLVTPIYHTCNTGVAQARIDALQAVTGDYATFLDGDDRFLPTKLEKEASLLRQAPQAQIAFSNVYYIDEKSTRIGVWAEEKNLPQGNIFLQTFARDFPRRSLFRSELVHYQAWRKVGFHDHRLPNLYEDFDMRIRLTKFLHAVYCDEPLSEYRLHSGGLSRVKRARHVDVLSYIYHKNRPLLSDLCRSERKNVKRRLGQWIAKIAKQASDEALNDNHRLEAVKLLLAAWYYDPSFSPWLPLVRTLRSHTNHLRIAGVVDPIDRGER